MSTSTSPQSTSVARERLLTTASRLFYSEGIHGLGVDRVLREANVTRATLYRHFEGKEQLVAAYLEREDASFRKLLEAGQSKRHSPRDFVELVINTIADDIERNHTRGCPFINAAAEYSDPRSEVRRIVARHRDWLRATIQKALESAEVPKPKKTAASLVLLRDAAFIGSYLDGVETVRPAFVATARRVAGIGAAPVRFAPVNVKPAKSKK